MARQDLTSTKDLWEIVGQCLQSTDLDPVALVILADVGRSTVSLAGVLVLNPPDAHPGLVQLEWGVRRAGLDCEHEMCVFPRHIMTRPNTTTESTMPRKTLYSYLEGSDTWLVEPGLLPQPPLAISSVHHSKFYLPQGVAEGTLGRDCKYLTDPV